MVASRNDQYALTLMLTEAEGKRLTAHSPENEEKIDSNESLKQLLNTREPCSGNTALHWACKYGVIKV